MWQVPGGMGTVEWLLSNCCLSFYDYLICKEYLHGLEMVERKRKARFALTRMQTVLENGGVFNVIHILSSSPLWNSFIQVVNSPLRTEDNTGWFWGPKGNGHKVTSNRPQSEDGFRFLCWLTLTGSFQKKFTSLYYSFVFHTIWYFRLTFSNTGVLFQGFNRSFRLNFSVSRVYTWCWCRHTHTCWCRSTVRLA